EEIANLAWERREEFLGGVSTFEEAAAAITSLEPNEKPLVLVDIGDNPWTGGPGDSVELLRFLLDQGTTNAVLALISDPEAVQCCIQSGPGNTVSLHLGAKRDRLHGDPILISAYIRLISNGHYVNEGPMMAGVPVELGPTTLVVVEGVEVLVTTR